MLFKLSSELIKEEYFSIYETKIIRAVENILRSVWESKHLVYADIDVILFFRNVIKNNDCLSVLMDLENNFSFLNYDNIKYFIRVVPNENVMDLNEVMDFSILNLSIDYFQKSDLTTRTRILCENESDAFFFKKIAEYYCTNSNIGNLNLAFEEENGGGNNTHNLYQKHIDNFNIFCLCFCDNDKKYPEDTIKDTLKKVKACTNSKKLCAYIGLEVHEIENLIPFNYFEQIKNKRGIQSKGINFVLKIKSSEDAQMLKYLDIKKGIISGSIKDNTNYLNFAKILINHYNEENLDLNQVETFSTNKTIVPSCGKVMKTIMSIPNIFDTEPDLLNFQKDEWKKIGSTFTFWTCARIEEPLNI